MIIMALDHCREFLHYSANIDQNPLDLSTTTPTLFITRWITHFCAPVFVFLSGTGIFLYSQKRKSKKQVLLFLLTRGLWLMLAEIFIIGPLWDFNFSVIFLQVIWAIGLSMVFLSVLQFLPFQLLSVIGLLIVFGHNLLDNISIEQPFWKSALWSIVHVKHFYPINERFLFVVSYPFLPWLGLMICGYALGKLYISSASPEYRKKFLLYCGLTATILFIIIRWSNLYGDLHDWSSQKTALFSFFDFINTSKYPPSLLFILMTIGPSLIFLSFAESLSNGLSRRIVVFGKVPFFYYILHVVFIHSFAWLIFFATGHNWSDLDFIHFRNGSLPYGSGYPLWTVYVVWAIVIIVLYFPCRWYSKYKSSHNQWWLSYI
jgi:uncharacterized membrane protein